MEQAACDQFEYEIGCQLSNYSVARMPRLLPMPLFQSEHTAVLWVSMLWTRMLLISFHLLITFG